MASRIDKKSERCVVLVKAMPHVGERRGETVCCAGVTPEHKWARQYPVVFRALEDQQQFKRWQWIEYEYLQPRDDARTESRRVIEQSIRVCGELKRSERASFLRPIVRSCVEEAMERSETLALIEPREVRFSWEKKGQTEIDEEAAQFEDWASQLSFLRDPLNPIEPCPLKFIFKYKDGRGKDRVATCADWETAAMYRRFRRLEGEETALAKMKQTFAADYPAAGMVFAMGTHSLRPKQWLLVGVLRLDRNAQGDLLAI